MAWQKGPGEGFHAAKDDALAINPKLRCRAIVRSTYPGGPGRRFGFVVEDENGKTIGKNVTQARDAWADAFFKLGGRYEKGRAVLPIMPQEHNPHLDYRPSQRKKRAVRLLHPTALKV